MGDVTILNPAIRREAEEQTILNPALFREKEGDVSQHRKGRRLLGKYEIVEKMNLPAGEADLYLCRWEETQYAAKV